MDPASAPLLTITDTIVKVPYSMAGAPGSRSLEGSANTIPWCTRIATTARATPDSDQGPRRMPRALPRK